jgi:hypothetical protein
VDYIKWCGERGQKNEEGSSRDDLRSLINDQDYGNGNSGVCGPALSLILGEENAFIAFLISYQS